MGALVMAEIFESVVPPVGTADTQGAWLRRWRVLAIDWFDVDMPDTPENAAEFGYAGSGENRSACRHGKTHRAQRPGHTNAQDLS